MFREKESEPNVPTNDQATPATNEQDSFSQEKDMSLQERDDTAVFVTDVDPDVNHWQTKETEFFTIKFPKEWYWIESDRERTGYRSQVITNNPDFNIDKYADISLGSAGDYPLILANSTEVIMSFNGSATSDAGSSKQSIESKIRIYKRSHDNAQCVSFAESKRQQVAGRCLFVDENRQEIRTYFIANTLNTIFFSIRMIEDNSIQRSVADSIARSIDIRMSFD